MGICPFCETEIHLNQYFEEKLGKKFLGMQAKTVDFKGEMLNVGYKHEVRMYACPNCNKILGFSEHRYDSST